MFLFRERTTTCVRQRKTTRKHYAYSEMTVKTQAYRAHIFTRGIHKYELKEDLPQSTPHWLST